MVLIFKYGNLTETNFTSESLFKDLKTVIFNHKSSTYKTRRFSENPHKFNS